MSLCPRFSDPKVARRISSLPRRSQLTVPHEYESVASALSPPGCPCVELVGARSLRQVAPAEEFAVFTLSLPGCPGYEFVVCTPLEPGYPSSESVRFPIHREVSSSMNASAFRFPDPRSARCRPVSQTTSRAPFMDSENHAARSLPRLPANSHEPHCTGRPYFEADLPPGFPDKKPTSRMSRPRHEAVAPAPVARCDHFDLTARSPALPALLHSTGFPAEQSHTATRCTHPTKPPRRRLPER